MNFLYFSVPQVCAHLPSSLRDSAHAVPFVIARQYARRPLCHCEPVLRLVWQSRTRSNVSAGTRRFPRQSSAAALCRAQPPKAALSAEQCALPWQSQARSTGPIRAKDKTRLLPACKNTAERHPASAVYGFLNGRDYRIFPRLELSAGRTAPSGQCRRPWIAYPPR